MTLGVRPSHRRDSFGDVKSLVRRLPGIYLLCALASGGRAMETSSDGSGAATGSGARGSVVGPGVQESSPPASSAPRLATMRQGPSSASLDIVAIICGAQRLVGKYSKRGVWHRYASL